MRGFSATRGVVAAGHELTAQAGAYALREGGNAFDAAVAAHWAACVVEPVLASLGGGSFLLAQTAEGSDVVYDAFVQTPRARDNKGDLDFFPIIADFGAAQQEFHIGLASIATPGTVKGLFAIQRDLCRLPMATLAAPAIDYARSGVTMNAFQSYVFSIVSAIYTHGDESRRIYGSDHEQGHLVREGEILRQPELAATLEALAREGEALFYEGVIAANVAHACAEGGGLLSRTDFNNYAVMIREPLIADYSGATLVTNPPPSTGGLLNCFALQLLEATLRPDEQFGTAAYLDRLAQVMRLTGQAKIDALAQGHPAETLAEHMLDVQWLARYRREILDHARCSRGTTHISAIDEHGNVAAMSTSNGEGCGFIAPGTGIMLNNMLGEEDLNPGGFHRWPTDSRMISMLAPTILRRDGGATFAIGSGGSNRLRSAILQVVANLLDFGMSLEQAVDSPRIHVEGEHLSVEGGFDEDEVKRLVAHYPEYRVWREKNLFFGGTHCVSFDGQRLLGVGDARRSGAVCYVD